MGRPLGSKNKATRSPKVVLTCEMCGASFQRYPSQIKRPNQGRFCSHSCARSSPHVNRPRGETHPGWLDGNSSYRQRALEHYGAYCSECGYDKHLSLLDVHHKDFKRTDHRLANLVVLCIRCHMERHLEHGHLLRGGRGVHELRNDAEQAGTQERIPFGRSS